MKYVAISAMDALVNYSLEELRRGHYTIKSGGGGSNEVTEAGLAQLIEVRLPKTDSFEIRVRKSSSLPLPPARAPLPLTLLIIVPSLDPEVA